MVVGGGIGAVGEFLCGRRYFGVLHSSGGYKVGDPGGDGLQKTMVLKIGFLLKISLFKALVARRSTRRTDWESTS